MNAFGLVAILTRVSAGYYAAPTTPDKQKLAANGKRPMQVPILNGRHCTDTRSTTTKLHITADDGGPPPLPAAPVDRAGAVPAAVRGNPEPRFEIRNGGI